MSNNNKVLLLGGTGAMGIYLQEVLSHIGYDVYVTTRKLRQSKSNINYIQGNAQDINFIKNIYQSIKPDAVVDFMIYNTNSFKDRVSVLLQGTQHYLFLSSYRVFSEQIPLTEISPRLLDISNDKEYLKTEEYGLTKARQEDILRSSRNNNWTIIRPGITYSKERFQFGCLEADSICYRAMVGAPVVMPIEMKEKQTVLTWGKDVAKMISRLVLNPKALGEDFICASNEHKTWGQIEKIYRDTIGLKVMNCSLDDYIRLIRGRYQVIYDRMFDRVIDNTKILRVTGMMQNDITPIDIGLREELNSFMSSPHFSYIDWRKNIILDELTNTRINLNDLSINEKCNYLAARYPYFCGIPYKIIRKFIHLFFKK